MIFMSSSTMPLVVTAGVPIRIPPGFAALKSLKISQVFRFKSCETYDLSPTTEFLFVVMCI